MAMSTGKSREENLFARLLASFCPQSLVELDSKTTVALVSGTVGDRKVITDLLVSTGPYGTTRFWSPLRAPS